MHTLHGEHIASKYYLVFTGKRQFQRASRAHRDKKLGGVEGFMKLVQRVSPLLQTAAIIMAYAAASMLLTSLMQQIQETSMHADESTPTPPAT
jgi:hypothetical protein